MRAVLRLFFLVVVLFDAAGASAQAEHLTGTLVVLNKGADSASFIDLASGETLATLPTGRNPHELVVTRDGRWAVTTNYRGGNSLTVYDVANLRVAATVDLSARPAPHGLLLTRNQDAVVVTTEDSNEVLVVDFRTGAVRSSIDTQQAGSHMVALKEDGSMAFTANTQADSVSVIDLAMGNTLNVLAVPGGPEAITANWSATDLWVGSNDDGVVSVIDPATGAIRRQLSGFGWPYRILLTGDERFVIVPDARAHNLRVFDARSGEETGRLELPGAAPQGVALYGDDRTLFLALSAQDKAVAIAIDGMTVLREYATGSRPDGIGYSPVVHRRP